MSVEHITKTEDVDVDVVIVMIIIFIIINFGRPSGGLQLPLVSLCSFTVVVSACLRQATTRLRRAAFLRPYGPIIFF